MEALAKLGLLYVMNTHDYGALWVILGVPALILIIKLATTNRPNRYED